MKRKGLAILLAFCLVLSLVPVLASADNSDVSKDISIYDDGVTFLVVKGGRMTIDSESYDDEGSYVWEVVENDGIVSVMDNQEGKALYLKALKVGTATFRLIVDDEETVFYVQVVSNKAGVSISPESLVVPVKGYKYLDAIFTSGTTAEVDADFTWGSEDPDIATVGKYSGKVTGVKKGETTITAHTEVNGESWSKSCKVTVEDPYEIKYVENDNGEVSGPEEAVRDDNIYVSATPNDNYKVISIQVARDDTGEVFSSKKPNGTGVQRLNFEMPDCDVTVSAEYEVIDPNKKPLKGIVISEEEAEVPVNAQFKLDITCDPADTTDETEVVWTTSNKRVATVEDGIVTGVKKGNATITATVGDFSEKCEVEVTDALTSVDATADEVSVAVDKSKTLEVTYKTSDNDHLIAKWESKDPTIATVDENGVVTGRKIGETEITVTVGGKSDTIKVTVKKNEGDYKIVLNTIKNGTVTASKAMADEGEEISLIVVPEEGYELGELKVVDAAGKNVDLEDGIANEFVFTMPKADVVVSASFDKAGSDEVKFIDVKDGIWYEGPVYYCASKGYLDGVGNNMFNPTGNVTRGQLCTILYAMEGKPTVTSGSVFPDVAVGKYYYDPVRWAASKGIVAGYTDGTFKPEVAVSRQQLASVLYKYTSFKGYDLKATADITGFKDYSSVSTYAMTPLRWAVTHKVMTGTNVNTLNPQGAATRAEFAVMLKAFDENVKA